MIKKNSIAVAALFVLAGCGTSVMIPPRIDLTQHEVLGVIEFGCTAQGALGRLTTKKFVESMRRDQGVVRVVALGTEEDVLKILGQRQLDRDACVRLGKEQGLKTLVVGELTISDVTPAISITPDLGSAGVTAQIEAALTVDMIETETGASLWSRTASDRRTVGNISLLGGKQVIFNATDPEKAYGGLVNSLVADVTADFHVRWTGR